MIRDKDALAYHSEGRRGKIEVVPTKPCITQRDLSLAYTPGVAAPCLEIQKDPEAAFRYTARGNLVAVISNGTAVLGLGDIGPLAGKPVMEGKAVPSAGRSTNWSSISTAPRSSTPSNPPAERPMPTSCTGCGPGRG
jgi:hypothetical protein